jgi:hypothetical protein
MLMRGWRWLGNIGDGVDNRGAVVVERGILERCRRKGRRALVERGRLWRC